MVHHKFLLKLWESYARRYCDITVAIELGRGKVLMSFVKVCQCFAGGTLHYRQPVVRQWQYHTEVSKGEAKQDKFQQDQAEVWQGDVN